MGTNEKKERTKGPAITPEKFVTAWQTSENVAEVVEKTGLKESSVRARAQTYRKAGVGLKQFTAKTRKLDVGSLNALIEDLKDLDHTE